MPRHKQAPRLPDPDLQRDLELFAELVTGFPDWLYGGSSVGLADWVMRQVERSPRKDEGYDELRRTFRDWLTIDSPEQIAAERVIARLLTEVELQRSKSRSTHAEQIGRDVDWGRTYSDSISRIPARYWCRERVQVPDYELRGALLWIARAWHRLLANVEIKTRSERILRLAAAICYPRRIPLREVPFSRTHLERLRHLNALSPTELRILERALMRQLSLPVHEERRRLLLESLLRTTDWGAISVGKSQKVNLLLELSVRMGIVRAACEKVSDNGKRQAWVLVPGAQRDDSFVLHSSDGLLECRVAKSFFIKGKDAFRIMRHLAGLDDSQSARDGQPDIHLCFKRTDNDGPIINIMGDTKRNSQDKGLFRDGLRTATYYMLAYHKELGLRSGADGLDSDVRPVFTLFFRRGVKWPPATKDSFYGSQGESPILLAMDMESHFAPTETGWESSTIRHWFRNLVSQVDRKLRTGPRSP